MLQDRDAESGELPGGRAVVTTLGRSESTVRGQAAEGLATLRGPLAADLAEAGGA